MSRTIGNTKQRRLAELIAGYRRAAGLTQADVAKKLRRYQSFVATLESGQRRIDVIEFIEIANAIGFDPNDLLTQLKKGK
jgi:transcriptional regulator with XRE-family HTH domain